MTEKKQIGKILLRQRALSPDQLERALAERKGGRLASRLAAEGTITDVSALKALSEQHGIPGIDLNQVCFRLENLDLLPREIAEKHLILPVLVRDDRIFIAMANPRETKVVDEIEFVTGKKVYPYVALEGALERVIQEAYARKTRGEEFYVGPTCPPEVQKKLGVDSSGRSEQSAPDFGGGFQSSRPLEAPGVVVDDDVGRVSRSDEIAEEDFGNANAETSVVAALPDDAPVSLLPEPPPGAKSVLVVDDEADIRRMLARLLAKSGYKVIEADRGLLALRLVKEQTPDLIVLDAMLPEVHGFEIARRIKGSQRYGHIPIIMISAVYRGWRYAEDLKQNFGVDEFIEKPFRIADVVAKVEDCLARREKKGGGARASDGPAVQVQGETVVSDSDGLSSEAERALAEGVAAYQAGRLDEAVEHLRRGIGIDPLAFRLHFHLGLLYGRKGEVFDAISELETAVSINGSHFAAAKNLAILYQKAGFRHKAVEMWERAHALAADDATRLSIKEHLLRLL